MTDVAGANPIKVLSLHWGYSLGGVGKYGVLVDKAAKSSGVAIEHVCIRGCDWQVDERTLADLKALEILLESRLDFSWYRKLCRHVRAVNPALIMTHGFNGHFIARLLRLSGCHRGELISSYHGLYHATSASRRVLAPVFNRFTEWHVRRTLGTVAVAEDSRRYLVGKGIPGDLVQVIHNGIEDLQCSSKERRTLRAEWKVSDDQLIIGVASRLDPVKGLAYLLDAFSRLASKHQNVVLVVVGTGAVEEDLQAQARKLGIDGRVRFTGFRSDVAQCLSAFDIFALPSLAEYHSIALLEAMRAGKAIVATNVGGNTESVRDMQEALIISPADVCAMGNALDRLLSDRSLRSQLGSAARQRFLAEFTEGVMLKRTAAWLTNCAEQVAHL